MGLLRERLVVRARILPALRGVGGLWVLPALPLVPAVLLPVLPGLSGCSGPSRRSAPPHRRAPRVAPDGSRRCSHQSGSDCRKASAGQLRTRRDGEPVAQPDPNGQSPAADANELGNTLAADANELGNTPAADACTERQSPAADANELGNTPATDANQLGNTLAADTCTERQSYAADADQQRPTRSSRYGESTKGEPDPRRKRHARPGASPAERRCTRWWDRQPSFREPVPDGHRSESKRRAPVEPWSIRSLRHEPLASQHGLPPELWASGRFQPAFLPGFWRGAERPNRPGSLRGRDRDSLPLSEARVTLLRASVSSARGCPCVVVIENQSPLPLRSP